LRNVEEPPGAFLRAGRPLGLRILEAGREGDDEQGT
jgi:hypothetical protein